MLARICVATALAGGAMSTGPARAAVVNQWVQFAPDDTVLIRAIEDDPNNGCPAASVDGQPVALAQRGPVTTAADAPRIYYPVLMCESAPIPAFGHAAADVAGVPLRMPAAHPRRILVIGDTGCRVTAAVSGSSRRPSAARRAAAIRSAITASRLRMRSAGSARMRPSSMAGDQLASDDPRRVDAALVEQAG